MSTSAFDTLHFAEPQFLWLLVVPALLLVLWIAKLVRHRADRRRYSRHRRLPVRERLTRFGGLLSWLCLVGALVATILAMSRPTAAFSLVQSGGVDLVILQDGSASMRVSDVTGDRWQRSIQFLRVLGDALRWKDDRIAMALFAHVAEPQVRLTKDPNTYFFFLDHLDREPPFRLEDETTWDTNIELGVYWGVRLVEKDEQLHGASSNAKAFVLVSDGQAWSGQVAKSIALARERDIPIFVVGVGTSGGGLIPEPAKTTVSAAESSPPLPIYSSLDRASLGTIAAAGGGQYLEIGRESDQEIANQIIDATRRRSHARGTAQGARDLYWSCLLVAACLMAASAVFVQERAELWFYAFGAGATLAVVWTVTRP
jgi:Ca-activated chloride channel family protein